jgi:4-oxalmesaconate hydratase
MAADKGWDFDGLLDHIYFDTCVYHQPGIDLLLEVVPAENILFASEMVGAVRGINPDNGCYYDDTKVYLDSSSIDDDKKQLIFQDNTKRVFPRLEIS